MSCDWQSDEIHVFFFQFSFLSSRFLTDETNKDPNPSKTLSDWLILLLQYIIADKVMITMITSWY